MTMVPETTNWTLISLLDFVSFKFQPGFITFQLNDLYKYAYVRKIIELKTKIKQIR